MSFALDRYEPIAFHTDPERMRTGQHPAPPPPATPLAAPATPLPPEPPPVATAAPEPPPAATAAPEPVREPIAAYVVGLDATDTLRRELADFLDAAGSRRDVRVSVGVASGPDLTWVLRDEVPARVRALPRYSATTPPEVPASLAAVASAVTADAADHPTRRTLVVLVWDRPPDPVAVPPALASALVLHCADAVVAPGGDGGGAWLLARSRAGGRPGVLAHAGRLLDHWTAFAPVPPGLALSRAQGDDTTP